MTQVRIDTTRQGNITVHVDVEEAPEYALTTHGATLEAALLNAVHRLGDKVGELYGDQGLEAA